MKQNKLDEMLINACRKPNPDIVQAIIEKGANVNMTIPNGWTPLHLACLLGHTDIVQVLLSSGADINVTSTRNSTTPLHFACEQGHMSVVKVLLENDADVNVTGLDGYTPLQHASFYGNKEIVKLLEAHIENQERT